MTYVINPWFFYLISIADGLKTTLNVIAGGCFITLIILIAITILGFIFDMDIDDFQNIISNKFIVKGIKILFITFILSLLLSIFIPSKTTLYQMIIAKNITYENIEKTKKEGIKLVDYIIEKTEEYNEKKDGD